jgi:hypothetical protein
MNARDRTGAAALMGAAVTGLIAFALFLGGGLLLWANGHYKDADGYLTTGAQRFSTQQYALTTASLEIGTGGPGFLLKADRYGTVRLDAMPKGGKPLFVGVARTRDVDAYLLNSAHTTVTDIDVDPFEPAYEDSSGTGTPARPADQRFWAATSDGSKPLDWKVKDGTWSVVLMNADGSRGVDAKVSAGASLPWLDEVELAAWIGAAFMLVLGGALLAGGLRLQRQPSSPDGSAWAA